MRSSIGKRTILPQDFCSLHIDLLGVQDDFVRWTSDFGIDLHDALVLPRATQLQIEERNMIVDGLSSNLHISWAVRPPGESIQCFQETSKSPIMGASLTRQAECRGQWTPSCELQRNSVERERKQQDAIWERQSEIGDAAEGSSEKRRSRRRKRRGRGGERLGDAGCGILLRQRASSPQ